MKLNFVTNSKIGNITKKFCTIIVLIQTGEIVPNHVLEVMQFLISGKSLNGLSTTRSYGLIIEPVTVYRGEARLIAKGRIFDSSDTDLLSNCVRSLIGQGYKSIAIDMNKVTSIETSAVAGLLKIIEMVRKANVGFVVDANFEEIALSIKHVFPTEFEIIRNGFNQFATK